MHTGRKSMTRLVRLDHIQLAMPEGREYDADAFYAGVLGLTVVPKPAALAARGGRWYVGGEVTVHLGVDPAFTPARRAHPAFIVAGLSDLVAELALGRRHVH